jgi:hypothetical protein
MLTILIILIAVTIAAEVAHRRSIESDLYRIAKENK